MALFRELPVLQPGAPSSIEEARPLAPSRAAEVPHLKKPPWLKIRPPAGEAYTQIKGMLRERKLHTVCEEARCPNVAECWSGGTATFMLGGDTCTRACRFCAIKTARRPPALDPEEPKFVGESVVDLGLKYVVLTSVDRDDLEDGGAEHFAATIRTIKQRSSAKNTSILVEALVPDFKGDVAAIEAVVRSGVDVYAHNVETVERLQYRVRDPRAGYAQSMLTLRAAKNIAHAIERPTRLYTKTSIMLGLGETREELLQAFADLREFDVDVLTLGQYLRPTVEHLPVEKFYTPEEFKELETLAMTYGFLYVASGPLVRSSYKAAEFFLEGVIRAERGENPPSQHFENTKI